MCSAMHEDQIWAPFGPNDVQRVQITPQIPHIRDHIKWHLYVHIVHIVASLRPYPTRTDPVQKWVGM